MNRNLTPEDELCLLLCRWWISPDVQWRAKALLASPLRWPVVRERCYVYQILPLLYHNLLELGFPHVPEAVRAELKSAFAKNAFENTFMAGELVGVLRLLGNAGVPVIPLKGVALAESLYGDPALRACTDIDILVPRRHAMEAFHILVSCGYESAFTQPRLLELMVRYGKHCVLTRQEGPYTHCLELHLGLVWGGQLERELLIEIWADALRRDFHGVPALALSPEWELLYLAIHAAVHASRHDEASLKWLIDLDLLCRRREIIWKKVREKANLLGWEAAIRSSLAACASVFGTPVDPALGVASRRQLFHFPGLSHFGGFSEALFSLPLLKTPTQRLRYLAIYLFIPNLADCEFLLLPGSLFFLYYLIRPLRVACKTVACLVRASIKGLLRGIGLLQGSNRRTDQTKLIYEYCWPSSDT